MNVKKHLYILLVLVMTALSSSAFSESLKQQKMAQLSFMVGEWIGTTRIYQDGKVSKQGAAYQNIQYDLNQHILVIELNTELLQLHTVIRYDEKDQTYYYYPFSSNGAGKYPANYQNGQFIVNSSETNRFVFTSTANGGFREYGERLVDGQWVKYFEDTFVNSQ